jgi:hypothetical protein
VLSEPDQEAADALLLPTGIPPFESFTTLSLMLLPIIIPDPLFSIVTSMPQINIVAGISKPKSWPAR